MFKERVEEGVALVGCDVEEQIALGAGELRVDEGAGFEGEGGEDPRFSKEAKVLAQLAHPNIVPIYNIGVDAQGRPFYAMKLVKGRTLQAVLNAVREGYAAAVREYPRAALLTVF